MAWGEEWCMGRRGCLGSPPAAIDCTQGTHTRTDVQLACWCMCVLTAISLGRALMKLMDAQPLPRTTMRGLTLALGLMDV